MFFVLDLLNIFSVLNSRLPGPRWRARSHIVFVYNDKKMIFIRLLLANQIGYIFALMIISNNQPCQVIVIFILSTKQDFLKLSIKITNYHIILD